MRSMSVPASIAEMRAACAKWRSARRLRVPSFAILAKKTFMRSSSGFWSMPPTRQAKSTGLPTSKATSSCGKCLRATVKRAESMSAPSRRPSATRSRSSSGDVSGGRRSMAAGSVARAARSGSTKESPTRPTRRPAMSASLRGRGNARAPDELVLRRAVGRPPGEPARQVEALRQERGREVRAPAGQRLLGLLRAFHEDVLEGHAQLAREERDQVVLESRGMALRVLVPRGRPVHRQHDELAALGQGKHRLRRELASRRDAHEEAEEYPPDHGPKCGPSGGSVQSAPPHVPSAAPKWAIIRGRKTKRRCRGSSQSCPPPGRARAWATRSPSSTCPSRAAR